MVFSWLRCNEIEAHERGRHLCFRPRYEPVEEAAASFCPNLLFPFWPLATVRFLKIRTCAGDTIYSSSVYVQDYLFSLSFVFQTWIFLLCYFSCGRQTCFDCSTGGLSFPSHRLILFYSTGIARGCLFSTMRNAPGHWPGACLFIPI